MPYLPIPDEHKGFIHQLLKMEKYNESIELCKMIKSKCDINGNAKSIDNNEFCIENFEILKDDNELTTKCNIKWNDDNCKKIAKNYLTITLDSHSNSNINKSKEEKEILHEMGKHWEIGQKKLIINDEDDYINSLPIVIENGRDFLGGYLGRNGNLQASLGRPEYQHDMHRCRVVTLKEYDKLSSKRYNEIGMKDLEEKVKKKRITSSILSQEECDELEIIHLK